MGFRARATPRSSRLVLLYARSPAPARDIDGGGAAAADGLQRKSEKEIRLERRMLGKNCVYILCRPPAGFIVLKRRAKRA